MPVVYLALKGEGAVTVFLHTPAGGARTMRKGGNILCYLTLDISELIRFSCILHLRVMHGRDNESPLQIGVA